MAKTVVGIFEYESDAQNAQNHLLSNGFGDGDVDIKIASYKSGDNDSSADSDENAFERITNFFKELFKGDRHETERYTEAGKRGSIVTVHAGSSDEAVAAAQIMDKFGAIDVTNSQSVSQPGKRYEDPIVNPPGVSDGDQLTPNSVDARGLYLKSRIIDRPLPQEQRLRQQPFSIEPPESTTPQQQAPELNNTVAQRDALIKEIIDKDK
ncbi:hypothetical protein ACN9ML_01615 [Dyadobacter endophyticus]|uniref:Uncharacterized protein n=1 Tax=Dyadobacter endophyticus TaxID=1749036 RepID=A0ABQ1YEJ4_9BACT|nr:hypothetical protein [Dyadobacter endophyticus]GGH21642.1 hypothetical protein GCM10007423_02920 [Dyadobacter endophyticus]